MSDGILIEDLRKKIKVLEEKLSTNQIYLQEEKMISKILQLINNADSSKELMEQILILYQNWSTCEAVGIRIKEGQDFPYIVTSGFPDRFVELERHLCNYDEEGNVILDTDGKPQLECMCGNVLEGRFDPSKSFFTSEGSFFSNCTTSLLATTTNEDRQARTRNRCNGFGYESVALIPICSEGKTFGLIQLNDHKEGKFTAELIGSFRRVADYIAAYLAKIKSDEALTANEALTRSLIDSIPDLVWLKNAEGVYLACNKRFEDFYGDIEKNIIGKTDYDFVDKKLADFFRENDCNSIAAGKPTVNEEEIVFKKDGHKELLETIKTPLFSKDGSIIGVLGIGRDITTHKETEEILKKSEEQFRNLIRNTPAAIAMFDLSMHYIAASNRWISDYKLEGQDLIGVSHYDIFPEISNHWKTLYQLGMNGKVSKADEECFSRQDGTNQWIIWEIRPWYDSKDRIGGIIILTEDITKKKETEADRNKVYQQLLQAQKMESVGKLAGGVAHDLNNLLTPILGYSELLLEELNDTKSNKDALTEILNASIKARNIVGQLLAFSRKQVLEIKAVNINDIILSFKKLLRRTIAENIKMELNLSPNLNPVLADSGQLGQILMNLCVNASDAMPDGGTIIIETGTVMLDERYISNNSSVEPGTYTMLSVSDTGIGMDKNTSEHIFDPFYSTKGDLGTGLGLSTVYGIVKQHEGHIWVYSEPGKGSTIKIFLPITDKKLSHEFNNRGNEVKKGWETILIVEDNDGVRGMIESILNKMEYSVLSSRSAEEALIILENSNKKVHLLLTDIVLTGINGRELYEKAIVIRQEIKVLYMSGYTNRIIFEKGVFDMEKHFIQKPFSKNDLIRKIRDLLDEKP